MSERFVALALRARVLLALAAMVLVVAAPPASADGFDVWKDCADDGVVNQKHPTSDFADALKDPPADAAEYSDCLDQIRAAQISGSTGAGSQGAGGAGGAGAGTSGGGTSVQPEALKDALTEAGIDPNAPAPAADAPPPAVQVAGESVDLDQGRLPSLAGALSLPLPLAASAIVVLLSAALPLVRYVVARFGATPTGTSAAP